MAKKIWPASALIALSVFLTTQAFAVTRDYLSRNEHVPGEIIVRFKTSPKGPNATYSVFSKMIRTLGSASVLDIRDLRTDKNTHVVKLAHDQDLASTIASLKASPEVEIAEPNFVIHALDDGAPNDPDFLKSWGMRNIGQPDENGYRGLPGVDIGVFPLWQKGITGSSRVIVAVIDTGIDWTHPDLAANLYTNPAEVNGAPDQDNDGNGFIHDVHGWNFAANTNNSNDDHGHGTHCAGTIGAIGNNGVGIAGINWHVSLMPVKFLDADGHGNGALAIEAINYARIMHVNVMSNSWGGGRFSQSLNAAIDDARKAGIVFVAAAGNDGDDIDAHPEYPSAYPLDNVISVAATDKFDHLADFSNRGPRTVHVAAPGVHIYSTSKNGGYEIMSGTSMACPFVSGVSALLLSKYPQMKPWQIRDRLIRTSVRVKDLRHQVMSRGRVNAYNAFYNIVPPNTDPAPSAWKTIPRDLETEHPYYFNHDGNTFQIHVDGAKAVRVHFVKVDTEPYAGHVELNDQTGVIGDLSGSLTDYTSDYTESDTMWIRLYSDGDTHGYGFKIDKVEYIPQ